MYAVMFYVPDWDDGWGYTKSTIRESREDAVDLRDELAEKNPHIAYKVEALAPQPSGADPHEPSPADEVIETTDGRRFILRMGDPPVELPEDS